MTDIFKPGDVVKVKDTWQSSEFNPGDIFVVEKVEDNHIGKGMVFLIGIESHIGWFPRRFELVGGKRRYGIGWVEGDGSFSMMGQLTSSYEQAAKDAEALVRGDEDTSVVIFEVKEYFRSETTVKRTAA